MANEKTGIGDIKKRSLHAIRHDACGVVGKVEDDNGTDDDEDRVCEAKYFGSSFVLDK